MMISGNDIVITNHMGAEYGFEQAVHGIRLVWPNVVVENGNTGELIKSGPLDGWNNTYAGLKEIMVYKDDISRKSWDDVGASPQNQNTMIHILAGWDRITLVVDNPDNSDIKKIVSIIQQKLYQLTRINYK